MTLAQIERIILANIQYDRYSALSVDTDPGKVEDFANLHTCVNLAREEIKLNTTIPSLLKWTTAATTTAGTKAYSLPTRKLQRDIGLETWSKRLDYREYGGSSLLGVNGNIIIVKP